MPRSTLCRSAAALALFLGLGFATGCRSTAADVPLGEERIAEAQAALGKPMSGDMAALYHLRIPSSGGLRLSVVQLGSSGRLTVSDQFGAMISLVTWGNAGGTGFYDMREGCRIRGGDLSSILGVSAMPPPQVVRLLGGRLPASGGDLVSPTDDGRMTVVGDDWSATVTVMPDPWRIVAVDGPARSGAGGWRIRLKQHSGSLPGWIRVDDGDGRWAELELTGLEWDTLSELPAVPSLPACGVTAD